jgi:hypothetical protein
MERELIQNRLILLRCSIRKHRSWPHSSLRSLRNAMLIVQHLFPSVQHCATPPDHSLGKSAGDSAPQWPRQDSISPASHCPSRFASTRPRMLPSPVVPEGSSCPDLPSAPKRQKRQHAQQQPGCESRAATIGVWLPRLAAESDLATLTAHVATQLRIAGLTVGPGPALASAWTSPSPSTGSCSRERDGEEPMEITVELYCDVHAGTYGHDDDTILPIRRPWKLPCCDRACCSGCVQEKRHRASVARGEPTGKAGCLGSPVTHTRAASGVACRLPVFSCV